MKILYVFLFVVALVSVYYFVAGAPNYIVPSDTNTEVEETNNTYTDNAEADENTDHNSDSDMNTEMEPQRSLGDDSGMEFPTIEDKAILNKKEYTLDGFNFGFSMEEIRVKVGDTVTINLTVSDGFHDWVVEGFDAATKQIKAGDTTSVTFVADKAGTYEYYCSVGQHRANGMVGKLIVE